MNNQTQVAPVALKISDISIRQDDEGRYCLNDLHKAAGNLGKHQLSNYLRTDQAKDLIIELEEDYSNILNTHIRVIRKIGGRYGSTYVVKELVYAYAMWISASFSLKVIRAYDALQSQPLKNLEPLQEALLHITPIELAALIDQRVKAVAGEVMPKDCPKYHAPKSSLKMSNKAGLNAWMTYPELKNQDCLAKLLRQIKEDGHDVEGAIAEFSGMWVLLDDFYRKLAAVKGVLDNLDKRGLNIYPL